MGMCKSKIQPESDRVVEVVHPSKLHQIVPVEEDPTTKLYREIEEQCFDEVKEESYEKLNPLLHCCLYLLLCCQPVSILRYQLPESRQTGKQKETVVVDFGSKQFGRRRNRGWFLRRGLWMKHVLEGRFKWFGFRHIATQIDPQTASQKTLV